MSDWQPAKIIAPAGHPKTYRPDGRKAKRIDATGRVVRVREYFGDSRIWWTCGAQRFFQIHPEDAAAHWNSRSNFVVTCEHMIQTD